MRLDQLKQHALSLPHSTVVKQWGETLVFKIGGKMFLIVSLDGDLAERLSLKCSPEQLSGLLDRDGFIPAPYLARASWVCLEDPGAVSAGELQALVRNSYDLVRAKLPKKSQATLA